MNKSRIHDNTLAGFLVAIDVSLLLAISNTLTGFSATLFPKLSSALPTFFKKSFKFSASLTASDNVTDLFHLKLVHEHFQYFSILERNNIIKK